MASRSAGHNSDGAHALGPLRSKSNIVNLLTCSKALTGWNLGCGEASESWQ
jgi:hypothetical protein